MKSGGFHEVDVKWFEDGELNITENVLDRHLKTDVQNKTAILFESNDPAQTNKLGDKSGTEKITYKELHQRVCQAAELLSKKGIQKGDVVCLYMSMIPDLLISVLACARIGAIHSVVFGGFSAKALSERINDSKAKLVVTNDSGFRGDKDLPIKSTVDEALENVDHKIQVMVWRHSKQKIKMNSKTDFWANDEINPKTTSFPATKMMAEDPLFILYTSGSTGKPKGLVHTTAGYMIWASETFKNVFQIQSSSDVYWCTADIGWITGHSYITYAPLINGVTQVMFEGIPTWPDAGRFWQVIEKHKVTHFYTAPTAIRALQAFDLSFVKKSNLSSLKVLGTVGEPINEEAWQWYKKEIGSNKCPIVDTWWQTETGGLMISNMAGVTPEKPCFATLPLPGVDAILVDEKSKVLTAEDSEGHLCIRTPWPGMARSIFGDHERFIQTYFTTHPGFYFTGDGAKRTQNGDIRIIGRVDDVVNVSGHRIGTAEVEDIIDECEEVVEAAVIGAHHEIKGQCLVAFVIPNIDFQNKLNSIVIQNPSHNNRIDDIVVMTNKTKDKAVDLSSDLVTDLNLDSKDILKNILLKTINKQLTHELGAIAKLDRIYIVPGLPKTRSGKIMRRILRKIADGQTDFGDISTLLNPEVVEQILNVAKKNNE